MIRHIKLFLSAALAWTGLVALASDWYVATEDPNAADKSGYGIEAFPFKTIQYALDNAAQAGDTILVRRGDYDTGETMVGQSRNRVVIDKTITLKAVDGKAVTRIVGKWGTSSTSTSGAAADAVRCICVDKTASGTVIEGFTLLDGCVPQASDDNRRAGAGVYSKVTDKSVYVVGCDFLNCSGTYGGGLYGGTAIRCRFDNCQAGGRGAAVDASYLFACVIENCWHSSGTVRYAIQTGCTALNCTVIHNKAPGTTAGSYLYNCVFAYNDWDRSSGVQDIVGSPTQAQCTQTKLDTACPYQVYAPGFGDYRLITGTMAIGYGKTANKSVLTSKGVPEEYLKYDFMGNEIDWSAATMDAGAVQSTSVAARADVAPLLFSEEAKVEGRTVSPNRWICSTNWPVQYVVEPVVPAGKTFYSYGQTKGPSVYLQPDGVIRVMPPLASVTAFQTYTAHFAAAELWAEPSADGTDLAAGDGSKANPFKSLQAAMDAVTADYTIIYAKPGEYRFGGSPMYDLMNRVAFRTDFNVSIRPAPGSAAPVVICGADDPDTRGCGPNAVRCVYGSGKGSLLGVTLAGGRTRTDARTAAPQGNDDAHTYGAAAYYNENNNTFQLCDCIVTNCTGVKSILHRGVANRCRIVDNAAPIVMNRGVVATCAVARNRLGCYPNNGATLFQSTFTGNVRLAGETEFVAWYAADNVYNCIMDDPISAIRAKTGKELTAVGNWVWGNTGGTGELTPYCTHEDPVLADPTLGDCRLAISSPVFGRGMAIAQLWSDYCFYVGSDLNCEPMLVASDGTLTPGCYQSDFPGIVELPDATAGFVFEGAHAGRNAVEPGQTLNVTVYGDASSSRWTPGFVVGGVTNRFDSWPGVGTASFPYSDRTQTLVALPVSPFWYVDATGGNDVNPGFTVETAKRTLAGLFSVCDMRTGDIVNALPGTYGEGYMLYASTSRTRSRAVIPSGVTLRSTAGAARTVILGAEAPAATRTGYGCGENAVRCLYLHSNARVEGFTLTGGRTYATYVDDRTTPQTDINGGGACCADSSSFITDCIITNNAAYRGGGMFWSTAVNCLIMDNTATDNNAPGLYRGKLYGCVVDNNFGGNAVMYPSVVCNCTFGPDNLGLNGTSRANDLYFYPGGADPTEPIVFNSLIYRAANNKDYYRNCAFASDQGGNVTAEHIGPGSILTTSVALSLDPDHRPYKSSAVVDRGDASFRGDYLKDVDLGGVPRILNGGRIDIGALEYDWRVDYGIALGEGVTVTYASPNVVTGVVKGVSVPAGSLDLDWTMSGAWRRSFNAQVSGAGKLTVYTNGAELCSLSAAQGAKTVEFRISSDDVNVSLAFEGAGLAALSDFSSPRGATIILR